MATIKKLEVTPTESNHEELLSESRMAYLASEVSIILGDSPDRTHFDDEEKTVVTHLAWDCLHEDGELKLLVCLWKDGSLVLYQADGFAFNNAIAQRLIGMASMNGLMWDVLEIPDEEEHECEAKVEPTHKGVLH